MRRRCALCGEAAVREADATEIHAHGVPLGFETRWTCESCGQSFTTLGPVLYVLFLGGAGAFALAAAFGPISGSETSRILARLLLLSLAVALAVVGGTRLRGDRKNPPA
jgi:hypothetical protein